MFDHNFWYWLIKGGQDIADIVMLNGLPFHYDWGISPLFLTNMTKGLLMVLTFVGTFVRLSTLGIVVGIYLFLELARAGFAIARWVKELADERMAAAALGA